MFGMLMGVAMFSSVAKYQAEKRLETAGSYRSAQEQKKAEDVRLALENAILTENIEDNSVRFGDDLNIDRARSFLTRSTGKTKSGQEYTLKQQESRGALGADGQRVLITTSEDEFTREAVDKVGSAGAMTDFEQAEGESLAVFDSNAVRARQVKQSIEYLRMEESQIYRFWGSNDYKFPDSQQEYEDKVNSMTRLKDAWGQTFTYSRESDTKARLSFETPWGYKKSIKLDMDLAN